MENVKKHEIKLCMGVDGIERGSAWVQLALDRHELANGEKIFLKNNWNNNSYKIIKVNYAHGFQIPKSRKILREGKDEILSEDEFCKFVKNARKSKLN